MKLTIKTPSDALVEERDYRSFLQIDVDGEKAFSVYDGEPEDANLSRDFNDAWKVADLMKQAYEAGKKGEEFEVEDVEIQAGEDY